MRLRSARPIRRLVVACLLVASLLPRAGAAASLTGKDVQIIGKILGFLDPPRLGGVVAVVYAADNPESRADATAIVALFGAGLIGVANAITAEAVPSSSLGNGKSYAAVIVALGAASASIVPSIQANRELCITGDVTLVEAGACALAIRSDPRVEIIVNRRSATSAGIGFATAFRMLIHEI